MAAEIYRTLDEVVTGARALAKKSRSRIAAVMADDANVLGAIRDAYDDGFATGVLIGVRDKIEKAAQKAKIDLSPFEIKDAATDEDAAKAAMLAAARGEVEVIMKGKIATPKLLKALLSREYHLRLQSTLSHIAVMRPPAYPKLLGCTDGAMVPAPTLAQKVDMIKNALLVFRALGIAEPRVAVLAAVNEIVTDFHVAREAAILSHMGTRGDFGRCFVDGPLSVDAALSKETANRLPFRSQVAGQADILLTDSIETGNMLIKGLAHFAEADWTGVVVGARVPVSVVSRADSVRNKKLSLALAVVFSRTLRRIGGLS